MLLILSGDVELNPGPAGSNSTSIDIHDRNTKKPLVVNCGYARVAINELSKHDVGSDIDFDSRSKKFAALFEHCNIPKDSFSSYKNITYFNHYCEAINEAIARRYKSYPSKRMSYVSTVSVQQWKCLPLAEKKEAVCCKMHHMFPEIS